MRTLTVPVPTGGFSTPEQVEAARADFTKARNAAAANVADRSLARVSRAAHTTLELLELRLPAFAVKVAQLKTC